MGKILSRGILKEMDQNNLRNLTKLLASQPLMKMVTQLIVSVSLFSLMFSWSSLCSSTLMYYEKLYYFSRNSLQLLSIAMNKNCIFLICNGILVFLAKTSAFVRTPSGFDLNDMLQKSIGDGLQVQTEPEPLSEKHITFDESGPASTEQDEEETKEIEEETEKEGFEDSNGRADEVSISIAESDEEGGISGHDGDVENEGNEPKICWLFDDDDDDDDEEQLYAGAEEDGDDETEKLSTEELNQKFEDFIRRMKEEFRITEARQQLVMVN